MIVAEFLLVVDRSGLYFFRLVIFDYENRRVVNMVAEISYAGRDDQDVRHTQIISVFDCPPI